MGYLIVFMTVGPIYYVVRLLFLCVYILILEVVKIKIYFFIRSIFFYFLQKEVEIEMKIRSFSRFDFFPNIKIYVLLFLCKSTSTSCCKL